MDANLDIDPTGLSPHRHHITVVGVMIDTEEFEDLLDKSRFRSPCCYLT